MEIRTDLSPFSLSRQLLQILTAAIAGSRHPAHEGLILNFRDPGYSPKSGGYHPVEIMISGLGRILYITDFAYVGSPPFVELAKEIDFDFQCQVLQHMGREFPIQQGRELFRLWQGNFCHYHQAGVYRLTVEPM